MGLIPKIFRVATVVLLGAGLATTPSFAQQRARSANARGIIGRGYLGVGVAELTDDRVKALHLKDDQGVEIKHVEDPSPASRAGLKENDVVLEVNGKPVEDIEQFHTMIAETAPGTKVNLGVWRNGAKQTIAVTLENRPADSFFGFATPLVPDAPIPPMPPMPPGMAALPANSPTIGFEGESLSPQLAEFFGVRDGVLVRTVLPHTPAERAGLKAGDVVVRVNGTPVMSPREISGLVRSGRKREVAFTVVRGKKELALGIEVADQ